MSERETVCFHCGSSTDTPMKNHLEDGRPCPVCRNRLLEELPAPLPSPEREEVGEPDEVLGAENAYALDEERDTISGFFEWEDPDGPRRA